MRTRLFLFLTLCAAACLANGPRVAAQQPSSPPTLWNFLGIPQGVHKVRDSMTNRRGNFPGLERKPALKSIADPSNLESGVPAMEAAAKIKQAEDMKAQKIKAIKYLATIGCGCYDKDKTITNALLASLEDCTEEVRLATVQAIQTAAEGKACGNCHSNCCCGKELVEKLSEIAYERDDSGCFIEPSERVRAAAIQALRVCCPSRQPLEIVEELPDEQEQSEENIPDASEQIPLESEISVPAQIIRPAAQGSRRETAPQQLPQDRQARVMPPSSRRVSPGALASTSSKPSRPVVVSSVPFQLVAEEEEGPSNHSEATPVSSRRVAGNRSVSFSTPTSDVPGTVEVVPAIRGSVEGLDTQRGLVVVRIRDDQSLPIGSKLKVFSGRNQSTSQALAMEVVESRPGLVRARPLQAGRLGYIHRGDNVIGW